MPSRLAMIACREAYEGPWTIAKGNESKLEIFGLGQAEGIKLELETSEGLQSFEFSSNGLYAWPTQGSRYRVCKVVGNLGYHETTVRILLNGKH